MVEVPHLLAILLALGAAISAAAHFLFIRVGTEEGEPLNAVLVGMVINVLLLTPLVAIVYYPEYGLTIRSFLWFVAAGVIGSLMGRAFMYTSIERIGASRTAPIIASRVLISTALGVVVLGESLTLIHGIGVTLVGGGVAMIAWETSQESPDDLTRRELLNGLSIPLAAAIAFGWEPIFANFGFAEGTAAIVGLVMKMVAATLGFVLYLWWQRALPTSTLFRSPDMRWFVYAGIANTFFLLGYYLALEIAPVSVVVPIVVSSTLFVVVLSALFVPDRLERITWPLAAASVAVVFGVMLISVFG